MTSTPYRRVLLVGFMGAGKTTVGRALADALGWRFVDFDTEIEEEAGRTVAEIFEAQGEPGFRRLEAEVGARLLKSDRVVLASGGGWPAADGRLDRVPPGTATVWLDVGVDEALRRAGRRRGSRPLLAGAGARDRAVTLLSERAPFYAAADVRVDTERSSVEDVTARILEILVENAPSIEAE